MSFDSESFKNSKEFLSVKDEYDRFQDNIKDLNEEISKNNTFVSLLFDYRQEYTKVFLIFCATSFEKKITSYLPQLLRIENCPVKNNFFYTMFLNRKYHTLFDWNSNNANCFIGLFSTEVKTKLSNLRDNNSEFKECEKAFINLGRFRNMIVHDGIINYSFPTKIEDVYHMFEQSLEFISIVFKEIDSFIKN